MGTKYDWSKVPDDVCWIATDSDGDVCGFKSENVPTRDWDFMWFGRKPIDLDINPYEGDWKDSLEQRPVEKN